MSKKNFEKIELYLDNARHYYENSQKTLQKQEYGKTGELLWGAIAESVKAMHLQNNDVPINSHVEIRFFLKNLRNIYKQKDLQIWQRSANHLHTNFYETDLDEDTFLEYYQNGEQLYAFLNNKIMKAKRQKPKDKKN